ncbi:TylF/MycF/NovP-related O-methyltransferase [Pedobacter namyangjuensis]|uniref:TylF/MycF/NovP-related O-methyltransferase n=1 Tax=Pedobacter namyangjuensis TaxID=600626 RepID=UPI000DE2E516|nr:TylF/MycF/NovP-related O-methyltransferase [Pedobacter namyangjuensis]
MNNFFIAKEPYTRSVKASPLFNLLKKSLRFFKIGDLKSHIFDPMMDMTTVEQRISYFHLLNRVIDTKVRGEIIEFGTFTGYCALLFQNVIEQSKSGKELHLYDSFETQFMETGNIQDILIANFKKAKLQVPIMHKGYFQDTLPTQLPDEVAFVHMDCGFGGDKFEHRDILLFCLNQVYPKLSKGAICVLMDYMGAEGIEGGYDVNPGAKLAADEFLKDKPETMVALYGNECYHGYFVKQ